MSEWTVGADAATSPAPAGAPENVRVAVIDRDSGFVRVLSKRLEHLGWEHRLLDGPVPVETLVAMRLGAVVIDLTALGPQAWEYLERVSAALTGTAIVISTGPSTVAQRVRGLRLGADDWLNKPCHPEELIARVEAAVRRMRRTQRRAAPAIMAGEIDIRPDQFQAFVDDESIDLTRREFELISLLARAEGRVLEREEIYQSVWGYTMVRGDRSVDVFVRKLRKKLEVVSPGWRYIHTHFGVGYRFAAEPLDGHGSASIAADPPAVTPIAERTASPASGVAETADEVAVC
jgi:DNA-binding response OmpR family regulator